MKPLDLLGFPLEGLSLVEASAGTGKTYTIANLYLRFLLEKNYQVEQILVVTFTEAATQELRERIRIRIRELINVLVAKTNGDELGGFDPLLVNLSGQSTEPEKDVLSLTLAERQMDQAEIHTIHGFCQRLLQEYALDLKVPLQQDLLEDPWPVYEQCVQDFWRTEVLSLPDMAIGFVLSQWSDPSVLLEAIRSMFVRQPEVVLPDLNINSLEDWLEKFEQQLQRLMAFKERVVSVADEVESLLAASSLKRVKNKLSWWQDIVEWSEAPGFNLPFPRKGKKDNLFLCFTPEALVQETASGKKRPVHDCFEHIDSFFQSPLPPLKEAFLAHTFASVANRVARRKTAHGQFDFNDMISKVGMGMSHMDEAQKVHFVQQLRSNYAVALIDEFQDTDAQQYEIFNQVFNGDTDGTRPSLILIGDPKQAIYGFRGGDIATYLRAKHSVVKHRQGDVFTMDTNWRSSSSMVSSVNVLFNLTSSPFLNDEIPFVGVKAGKADLSSQIKNDVPALYIDQISAKDNSKGQLENNLAKVASTRISTFLESGVGPDGGTVDPGDIAVLVRSAREGELIKNALGASGIAARFLTRDNIYHSAEALSLFYLMLAMAEPKQEKALRRMLAEPLFGFTDSDIKELNSDAALLNEQFIQIQSLHDLWWEKGILQAIREALRFFPVHRYLDTQSIENERSRVLANVSQLAELLQNQSRVQKGMFALIRWFKERIFDSAAVNDQNALRPESDERLVQIVTMHKSKGLEYPIVFLPFVFSTSGADYAWYYNSEGRLTLDLEGHAENQQKAEQERLAEDMRLLYVALTRAKYFCFLGTAAYSSRHPQALGLSATAWAKLVMSDKEAGEIDDDTYANALQKLADENRGLIKATRFSADEMALVGLGLENDDPSNVEVPRGQEPIEYISEALSLSPFDAWKVHSFTGILREHDNLIKHQQDPILALNELELVGLQQAKQIDPKIDIHAFPKGSEAGTFLHTLFECIEFQSGLPLPQFRNRYSDLRSLVEEKLILARLVSEDLINDWVDYLVGWVGQVLRQPLFQGVCLNALEVNSYVSEMEFYYPVTALESKHFNRVLRQSASLTWSDIEFENFSGLLKGAIDLVFCHEDKYYIVDYKSNYLGDSVEDYSIASLSEAMFDHRYDLQYILYILALHRHLKLRLGPSYVYDKHIGGVYYLFLRGLNLDADNPSDNGVFFSKPDKSVVEALDALLCNSVINGTLEPENEKGA